MSAPRADRRLWVGFLLVTLLVAGVASHYASNRPDGLNRVAADTGFADRAQASPADRSPLAGYATDGVGEDRLSRGLAGLGGAALVLGIGGGLFWVLRRRDDPAPTED